MSIQPSIVDFLSELRTRQIQLWVEDHQLRYSAPKQALTPDLRAELVRRKAEIIAFLNTAQTTTVTTPRLQPVAHGELVPLSFAQQRLWLLDQLTPGSTAYIMPALVHLRGALNIPVFERSLNAILERHEVLRTTFGIVQGEPRQQIGPQRPLVVPVIDLQPLSETERAVAVERQTIMESTQPFDLQQGPLVRARLLRVAADEHLLLLTLHHIISDGWSLGVLLRELAALYRAGGDVAALPPLPVQYADYTLWQREWLQGAVREQQLTFWRAQLAGAPETLQLPTDHPRPPVQSFRGAAYRFQLPAPLTAALHALSRREDATLFMTLLTAWSTLLARLSGQWDLTVGTPIANRTQAAL
ncbi:MAG TPA: condensation domain-containing protein, partial [Herpetosiphonaceae bacterium]